MNNPCKTCAHEGDWQHLDPEHNTTCSTCVGFRRWEESGSHKPGKLAAFLVKRREWAQGPVFDPPSIFAPLPSKSKAGYNLKKALGFLPVALALAAKSKDRSTKVGAVALGPDFELASSGWNGFARGVNDNIEARHGRPAKYKWTCHAEENLVAQAGRPILKGCTVLVTSLHPCTACSRMMIQAGIVRVLAPASVANERWNEEEAVAMEMLAEAGVEVVRY